MHLHIHEGSKKGGHSEYATQIMIIYTVIYINLHISVHIYVYLHAHAYIIFLRLYS